MENEKLAFENVPKKGVDGDRGADRDWFLTTSVWWRVTPGGITRPIVFGLLVFLLIVLMIALSPSSDSHFIYTDF